MKTGRVVESVNGFIFQIYANILFIITIYAPKIRNVPQPLNDNEDCSNKKIHYYIEY